MNKNQILAAFGMAVTLAFAPPAARADLLVNGNFETTIGRATNFDPMHPGMLRTSANITGPGVTPITLSSWNTTQDGIGCVVFPNTALT